MKYAIVDGERREASRELAGTCPVCLLSLTPRCGRFRVPHWSHPPGTVDHRWEPETEWHRNWKRRFPNGCQEVVHTAENGERHIADVKTAHGFVLEFQNSPISEDERVSREAIYGSMCWIVNGQRLKRDRQNFFEALRVGVVQVANPLTITVPTKTCLLLRKWENSKTLVLFDFGEAQEEGDLVRFGAPVLWSMSPGSPNGQAVFMPIFRDRFVDAMLKNEQLIGVKADIPPARAPAYAVPAMHRIRPMFARPRRNWRL
jgi:hypothetical protein